MLYKELKEKMNLKKKNEKGFTMVELIIVIAILGIIGALLVPAYGTISAKARLTTDITTVKTLKRITESYKAEQGKYPIGQNVKTLGETLKEKKYLDSEIEMQTGADILISESGEIKLKTSTLSKKQYGDAYAQLDQKTTSSWCDDPPVAN